MMKHHELMQHVSKIIQYLANTLLLISIIAFVWSLKTQGIEIYNDQLLWTQLNSMWLVVIMLMLVDRFYIKEPKNK